MSTKDQQFQDYLDDRMTLEERAAFERALASKPEWAEALAEHLRMREALREEETLPPGFYTRARAEFEERQGSGKRRIFGLPWEAVGLAAATGLALALFVPSLIRDELPVAPSLGEAAEGLAEPERIESTDKGNKEQEVPERLTVQAESKKELRLDDVSAAKPAPPATEQAPRQRKPTFAPPPPSPSPRAAADLDQSAAEPERRSKLDAGVLERKFGKVIHATPLQADEVRRYGVISLDSADVPKYVDAPGKGRAGRTADAGTVATAAEEHGPAEGRVLIGPRDTPFSCIGVRLKSLSDQHIVYLGSVGPDSPASPGGCAIYLPNDDRPIVVVDP